MKLLKIFSKKAPEINFDSLSSGEKKRIMESALRSANKEQFEIVKAYRENCLQTKS